MFAFSANCPIGWLYFNNSCFKEFTTKLNWTDAKQACENMNSSLASIHSAEEDEFIASHVIAEDSDVVAIGFNDMANEGSFKWSDGSDVSYTKWEMNQPDDYGYGQDCGRIVVSWNKLWNDYGCFELSTFICRIHCA